MISTGFHVELPPGTEMQIRPRSGLALKHGFIIPNSPGTVDEDYRGVVMIGLSYLGTDPFEIHPVSYTHLRMTFRRGSCGGP